jgi:hypothetical protein
MLLDVEVELESELESELEVRLELERAEALSTRSVSNVARPDR